MDTNENKQILQHIFAELSKGNGKALLTSVADDVRWTVTGTTKFSGTRAGKREVKEQMLALIGAQLAGPVVFTCEELIAEGDRVVMQASGKATTLAGKPYNNHYCIVARFANGKVQEVTEYMDTELLTAAFGTRK